MILLATALLLLWSWFRTRPREPVTFHRQAVPHRAFLEQNWLNKVHRVLLQVTKNAQFKITEQMFYAGKALFTEIIEPFS